jgi:hypothetical protein
MAKRVSLYKDLLKKDLLKPNLVAMMAGFPAAS